MLQPPEYEFYITIFANFIVTYIRHWYEQIVNPAPPLLVTTVIVMLIPYQVSD